MNAREIAINHHIFLVKRHVKHKGESLMSNRNRLFEAFHHL